MATTVQSSYREIGQSRGSVTGWAAEEVTGGDFQNHEQDISGKAGGKRPVGQRPIRHRTKRTDGTNTSYESHPSD